MDQAIDELSDTENKKISSRGKINISLGTIFKIMDKLEFKTEINLFPNPKGPDGKSPLDLGVFFGAVYSF